MILVSFDNYKIRFNWSVKTKKESDLIEYLLNMEYNSVYKMVQSRTSRWRITSVSIQKKKKKNNKCKCRIVDKACQKMMNTPLKHGLWLIHSSTAQ